MVAILIRSRRPARARRRCSSGPSPDGRRHGDLGYSIAMPIPTVRKRDPFVPLTQLEFRERFFARYLDPEFDPLQVELERICAVAWDGYIKYRKAPRRRPAGPGYADPAYELSDDWRATRAA